MSSTRHWVKEQLSGKTRGTVSTFILTSFFIKYDLVMATLWCTFWGVLSQPTTSSKWELSSGIGPFEMLVNLPYFLSCFLLSLLASLDLICEERTEKVFKFHPFPQENTTLSLLHMSEIWLLSTVFDTEFLSAAKLTINTTLILLHTVMCWCTMLEELSYTDRHQVLYYQRWKQGRALVQWECWRY